MFPAPLRRAKAIVVERRRRVLFRYCFRRVQKSTGRVPSQMILRGLVSGWGNIVWSAQADYLAEMIQQRRIWKGVSLECGSGISTLVLAEIARQMGEQHIALEHDPGWSSTVRRHAAELGLDNLTIIQAPLRNYGEFDWYDVDIEKLPAQIQLVICDGPPGRTRGGRYGLVPLLRNRLWPGAMILVDDSYRPAEREMIRRWTEEFGVVSVQLSGRKPYARVQVPFTGLGRDNGAG
jgi:predicted O-methyltransferase YrrM